MPVSTHAQSIYREHQDNDRVVGAKVARVVGDALDGLVRVARAAHTVVVEELIHGAHRRKARLAQRTEALRHCQQLRTLRDKLDRLAHRGGWYTST